MDGCGIPDIVRKEAEVHVDKPEVKSEDIVNELLVLHGRCRGLEEQLASMQMGFNRLQEALQPALSTKGACGKQAGGGAEPAQ